QLETERLALLVRQARMQLPAGEDAVIGDADFLDLRHLAITEFIRAHLFSGLLSLSSDSGFKKYDGPFSVPFSIRVARFLSADQGENAARPLPGGRSALALSS